MKYYLAIDLGASSGRHIVGHIENGEFILEEIHRFYNGVEKTKDGLVWNMENLFSEIKIGIKKAFEKYSKLESIGIDSWAIDYMLMNGDQPILPCHAYRNERTLAVMKELDALLPFEERYKTLGVRHSSIDSIYQLFDDLKKGRLDSATDFLMVPEYLAFLLTGKKVKEYTNATTTGLVNAYTGEFDKASIKKLGLPEQLFPSLTMPKSVIGNLKEEIATEVGGNAPLVLVATHDTASAFESVDVPEHTAFLSSGTWSIIGAKLQHPVTSDLARTYGFTNEGGLGYTRYIKNLTGMWIVNELNRKKKYSFAEIEKMCEESSYNEFFDVNDNAITAPDDMETAVKGLLSNHPPKTDGDLFRAVYVSMATSYKMALDQLEETSCEPFDGLYIVGGGAKNAFLNKLTEEITKRKVTAFPIEATAIGNLKIQAER